MSSDDDSSDDSSDDESEIAAVTIILKRRRLHYYRTNKHKQEPGWAKSQKTRFDWDTYFEREAPREFRTGFRMHKESFSKLLGYIEPQLIAEYPGKANGNSGSIAPAVRLAAAIRMLAGGSSWDVKLAFCIHSRSQV